jgi:hypothetical protein
VFLSLRHPHDVQKSPRFGRAKFFRNHDRSGLNYVLGRLYCCVGAFAQVHGFEHGEGMFGDLLIIRISSHGSDSLRPVDYVVTGLVTKSTYRAMQVTAKELNVSIQDSFLKLADEVIE